MTARSQMVPLRASVAPTEQAHSAQMIDEATFHALYADAAGPLHAYVARTLGSAALADDVVQETFLRLLRRPVPAAGIEELRRYAFGVATNLIVDHCRARKRELVLDSVREHASLSEALATRLDVARQFGRLTLRERTLLWLAHVEGAEHREIAAMLGLRSGSIRVLLSRARKRLARLLREAGHEGEELR